MGQVPGPPHVSSTHTRVSPSPHGWDVRRRKPRGPPCMTQAQARGVQMCCQWKTPSILRFRMSVRMQRKLTARKSPHLRKAVLALSV